MPKSAVGIKQPIVTLLPFRSVFAGVVGGTAGTFSKITGALGKGLASLTFDDKFQQKRREQIKKRGRQTFGESFARSGKGLVMGFVDGATGVVTKVGLFDTRESMAVLFIAPNIRSREEGMRVWTI